MDNYQYHIFSPYRVCPLGAHVDHQHGIVTDLRSIREWICGSLQVKTEIKQGQWGDYVRGAKYALSKQFNLKYGINGVLQGSLPVGGISSSAAVLIAYVMAFAKANGISLKPFEVVLIASEAEREYIGLNNGLLDQACIALGQKNSLLFLRL